MTNAVSVNEPLSIPASSGGGLRRYLTWASDINNVNRVLFVLAAIAAFYFVLVILVGVVKLAGVPQQIRKLELSGAQAAASSKPPASALDLNRIDPALENRNVFQPAGVQPASGDDTTVTHASATYKLVGISEAENRADTYVMVENSQTKLTYFLQYEQPVEGLELEKIADDKVIVKIGGNSVELE